LAPVINVVVMVSSVVPAARSYQRTLSATMNPMDELATCLRTWRDRLTPADPASGRRRAPGLRREEVARLAGVSVDYLSRLEQGRASAPSPSVLAALARALRLSDDERDHLFRVGGQAPPGAGRIDRRITPGVQRLLDRFADVPVIVMDPAGTPVASNGLARALHGDDEDRNILLRHFSGEPSRLVRSPAEVARMEEERVADLHDAAGRYPADEPLRELINHLLAISPRFAELWEQRPVARHVADRKTFDHPELGHITLDCDVLTVAGSDLRVIVYSAAPGSPDERALRSLVADAVPQMGDLLVVADR
jgi:transcriptional regulator with XRE-family HTH domain